jgi:hypothetical protein
MIDLWNEYLSYKLGHSLSNDTLLCLYKNDIEEVNST